jgi:hypothetical protein
MENFGVVDAAETGVERSDIWTIVLSDGEKTTIPI